MFYSIVGVITQKTDKFVVVENHGLGFRIFVSKYSLGKLPIIGQEAKLFLYYHLRENAAELYGFFMKEELNFFELLIAISGIGPKSALGLLGLSSVENLKSAIISGKTEFLNRAPGIGQKTAERIILELKSKIVTGEGDVVNMEDEFGLEEALVDLGYDKNAARRAIKQIPSEIISFNDRLKGALKFLGGK